MFDKEGMLALLQRFEHEHSYHHLNQALTRGPAIDYHLERLKVLAKFLAAELKQEIVSVSDIAVERKIALLELLVKGCKRHPGYRAIREPRADCVVCRLLYDSSMELDALEDAKNGFIAKGS